MATILIGLGEDESRCFFLKQKKKDGCLDRETASDCIWARRSSLSRDFSVTVSSSLYRPETISP